MSGRFDTGGRAAFHRFVWAGAGVGFLLLTLKMEGNPIGHLPGFRSEDWPLFEPTCGVCWIRLAGWICFLRAWWIAKYGLWIEDKLHDLQPTRSLPDSANAHVTPYKGGDYRQAAPGQDQYLTFEGTVRTNNPNINLERVMKGRFRDE